MNQECHVSQIWSQYFTNESDVVSAGPLKTCDHGYNFCKVRFILLKNIFNYLQPFKSYYSQLHHECTNGCESDSPNTKCIFYNQTSCATIS